VTEVVTALTPQDDSSIAACLESVRSLRVVRRCADVAELLSVCGTGLGDCVVVSADLRGLDLTVVGRLRAAGLVVVGVHAPGDEAAERRLRQLSISLTLPVDAPAPAIEALVETRGTASRPTAEILLPDAGSREGRPAEPLSAPEDATAGWVPAGAAERGREEADGDPEAPSARGTVLAVWGPLGAPGRTTVAVNLAAELASRGLRVLLVDADTYGGCVAQTLGLLDEAPGLAAAARAADLGSLDVPVLARLAPEALPRLRVLTGLPRADRWPEISADALERVLELGRTLASVVVVDCGFCLEDDEELSYDTQAPRRNAATLTSLAAADSVLAVGAADAVSLQRFVRGLQELGTVPCPEPVPVVNRVRASSVGARPRESLGEVLHRFAGLEGVHLLPEDRDVVDAALLAGRTVVEHAPDSAFRKALRDLATQVVPASRSRQAAPARRAWGRRRRGSARGVVTA
jgi:MinD-like ATPase involved in chromosome partitioning or flagellar assembly